MQKNPLITQSSTCILNISCVVNCLFDFNTFWGIYSIPKESKYTAVFLSVNNEAQFVALLCLSSKFFTYTPSFSSFEKTPLNILLKEWSGTKNFDPFC